MAENLHHWHRNIHNFPSQTRGLGHFSRGFVGRTVISLFLCHVKRAIVAIEGQHYSIQATTVVALAIMWGSHSKKMKRSHSRARPNMGRGCCNWGWVIGAVACEIMQIAYACLQAAAVFCRGHKAPDTCKFLGDIYQIWTFKHACCVSCYICGNLFVHKPR